MASVTKLANGTYQARWRPIPNGPQKARNFRRKGDAERYLTTVEHSLLTGAYTDPHAGKITVGEHGEAWLARKAKTLRVTGWETQRSNFRVHVEPEFGAIPLRQVARPHVRAWSESLSPPLAPSSAKQVLHTFKAIMNDAVDSELIARNPADRITIGSTPDRRADPMAIAELARKVELIANGMPARWRAAVLLMAATGMRIGECLGFTSDRIDRQRLLIRVDRQLTARHTEAVFSPPKSRASIRAIPVTPEIMEMLELHLTHFPPGELGLVFTTPAGKRVVRQTWGVAFRKACAEVGAIARTHDLRHVCASSLIASGLNVPAVQAVLGHATPSETLDTYTHFWINDTALTREAIGAAFASLRFQTAED